jgi:hypothetical protein
MHGVDGTEGEYPFKAWERPSSSRPMTDVTAVMPSRNQLVLRPGKLDPSSCDGRVCLADHQLVKRARDQESEAGPFRMCR